LEATPLAQVIPAAISDRDVYQSFQLIGLLGDWPQDDLFPKY
jgi:hypothetical protein